MPLLQSQISIIENAFTVITSLTNGKDFVNFVDSLPSGKSCSIVSLNLGRFKLDYTPSAFSPFGVKHVFSDSMSDSSPLSCFSDLSSFRSVDVLPFND
ncbi:hypothetical protein [Capybara microvirus Cap1_SP_92]|nr:hypothetical protein [Capybara microvirus Cap1_SP_92]